MLMGRRGFEIGCKSSLGCVRGGDGVDGVVSGLRFLSCIRRQTYPPYRLPLLSGVGRVMWVSDLGRAVSVYEAYGAITA
jgi:hypothetical protein